MSVGVNGFAAQCQLDRLQRHHDPEKDKQFQIMDVSEPVLNHVVAVEIRQLSTHQNNILINK